MPVLRSRRAPGLAARGGSDEERAGDSRWENKMSEEESFKVTDRRGRPKDDDRPEPSEGSVVWRGISASANASPAPFQL